MTCRWLATWLLTERNQERRRVLSTSPQVDVGTSFARGVGRYSKVAQRIRIAAKRRPCDA